ncbi:MAG: ferrous iron transporter B [Gammaproteobacteria bacterium]|nr:MAG: ferrous iron transporter B [Gammaproteobacteria bacterium]
MSKVLLVGSPNAGKSMLFNRLTGLQQKVANFPGVTVSTSQGALRDNPAVTLVDFPGAYSLNPISGDETVAVEAFTGAMDAGDVQGIVCVVDATCLDKGLVLALQVMARAAAQNVPVVVAANMIDVLERNNLTLDAAGLSKALAVPVLPMSARSGQGVEPLREMLKERQWPTAAPIVYDGEDVLAADDNSVRQRASRLAKTHGPEGDLLIRSMSRADSILLHPLLGPLCFVVVMYLLFQSVFTWAAPMMDGVEAGLGWLADHTVAKMGEGVAKDFLTDAIFGGVGAFLVFVPQVFVLTLVVGLLEDSGYLSRAAVLCHRPLRWFGLSGKSFVPMLSGVACAIPGLYAARTVDSKFRRWLTWLAVPLMPCSARLPVYALLIAAFIPAQNVLGGWLGLQGLAMFGVYVFGMVMGLLVCAVVSRTVHDDGDDTPFVLEMPFYHIPSVGTLLRNAWQRSKDFVFRAGPVIFWVSVVVWILGYFPNEGADLGQSYLGKMGQFIEPLFAPLGLDWRYGVAIIASFLAREVFVGTLGTLFGIDGADENISSLADQIQASGLPLASGIALLVFFAIAAQCVSTLSVMRRESGGWKLPLQVFIGYGLLAYAMAWLAYRLLI